MTQPASRHDAPAFPPSADNLARKLPLFVPLFDSDRRALDALTTTEETFRADTDIVSEGMAPRSVLLLQEGMAVRLPCHAKRTAPDHDVPDPLTWKTESSGEVRRQASDPPRTRTPEMAGRVRPVHPRRDVMVTPACHAQLPRSW